MNEIAYSTETGIPHLMVTLTCEWCHKPMGEVEAQYADTYRKTCGTCEDWG